MEKNPSFINHNFRIVRLVTLGKKSASPATVTDCPIINRQMFVVSAIFPYLAEFDRILTL